MFTEEHRSNRSQAPDLAIHYQLRQLKTDFGLTAMLVDDDGNLISASDSEDVAFYRTLSAEVDKLAEGSNCRLLFAKLNEIKRIQPNQISTRTFLVQGTQFHIITIGGSDLIRDIGAFRVYFGLRRICEEGSFSPTVVSRILRKPEALTL